ncbi:MAG: PqiC family protein [Desulfobacterales bacterium]|nr:PqiC family protein [Desulfobacterales bacterium]
MITLKRYQYLGWILVLSIIFFSGCGGKSPRAKFYTLSAISSSEPVDLVGNISEGIAVGIGPVKLPRHIDRPQIVTRSGPHRLVVDEFNRWAGSLNQDILQVLTENLSILLASDRVAAYPWEKFFDPQYRVFLEINQFEGVRGDYVVLKMTWTITGKESNQTLFTQKTEIKETMSGSDIDTLVETKSMILAKLSRKIAEQIIILHKDGK